MAQQASIFVIRFSCNSNIFCAKQSESRVGALQRETHELRSKLEEDAEDTQEILRKYRSLVSQQTEDKRLVLEAEVAVDDMKHEKNQLEEKVRNSTRS